MPLDDQYTTPAQALGLAKQHQLRDAPHWCPTTPYAGVSVLLVVDGDYTLTNNQTASFLASWGCRLP